MVQGELFREEVIGQHLNYLGRSQKSFLSRYQLALSLDKIILVLIGMVLIFALTYSFGVERGKRVMEQQLQSHIPAHSETLPVVNPEGTSPQRLQSETVLVVKDNTTLQTPRETVAVEKTSVEVKPKAAEVAPQKPVSAPSQVKTSNSPPSADVKKQGVYTVQLVTYDSEDLAVKEIGRLKSKGHESFIIPSGRYFQVCANYFENHAKARSFLKQFRENGRYPDAFIRPVAR